MNVSVWVRRERERGQRRTTQNVREGGWLDGMERSMKRCRGGGAKCVCVCVCVCVLCVCVDIFSYFPAKSLDWLF